MTSNQWEPNEHQPDAGPTVGENVSGVNELTPDLTGRWLVTARTSQHIWDLEPGRWTYTRLPGPDATPMLYDNEAQPISKVHHWPKVGAQSLVFYDDPNDDSYEQWRICSRIQTIEPIPATAPAPGGTYGTRRHGNEVGSPDPDTEPTR